MTEQKWQDKQSETASDKKPKTMSEDIDQKTPTETTEKKTDQTKGQ